MKRILTYSIFLIIAFIFSAIHAQENNASTVWVRKFKNDTTFTQNNVAYHFFKDTYVLTQAKGKGNIIINKDTLKTDTTNVSLTDFQTRRNISEKEIQHIHTSLNNIFSANDSILIFNYEDLPDYIFPIRIFWSNNKNPIDNIIEKKNDTIISSQLKPLGAQFLVIAPDSASHIPAFYKPYNVFYKKISNENTPLSQRFSFLEWVLIGCVFLCIIIVICGIVILIYQRKKKNANISAASLKKSFSKFNNNKKKALDHLYKINVGQNNKTLKSITSCCEKVTELYNLLSESENNDSAEISSESLPVINSISSQLKKVENCPKGDLPNLSSTFEDYKKDLNKLISKIQSSPTEKINIEEETSQPTPLVDDGVDEMPIISFPSSLGENIPPKILNRVEDFENLRNKINELETANRRLQEELENANNRANQAESDARNISSKLIAQFKEEKDRILEEKERINQAFAQSKSDLEQTKSSLSSTENLLRSANQRIETLIIEASAFNQYLSGVPNAKTYCQEIVKLFTLTDKIQKSAEDLLNTEVEDKYYIYKYLATFSEKLSKVNMADFYTDVVMIAQTGFTIKGTPLSGYDPSLPKEELENLVKNYFYTTYLKKYVDAVVVFNESFAGLYHLMPDMNPTMVEVFSLYRDKISVLCQALGIQIFSVKVLDAIGDNIDLLVTEVDAGISQPGVIVEIENCKVSLIGGAPSDERIRVKIQS